MRKWLLAMGLLLASCVQVDDRTTEQVIRTSVTGITDFSVHESRQRVGSPI